MTEEGLMGLCCNATKTCCLPCSQWELLLDKYMLAVREVRGVDDQAIRESKLFVRGSCDIEPEKTVRFSLRAYMM
jgi:hypothetical protein